MTRWTALGFSLGRKLTSDILSRKVSGERNQFYHVVNLHGPDDVDDQILEWLTEAYHTAGGTLDTYYADMAWDDDPMVPEDVDDLF